MARAVESASRMLGGMSGAEFDELRAAMAAGGCHLPPGWRLNMPPARPPTISELIEEANPGLVRPAPLPISAPTAGVTLPMPVMVALGVSALALALALGRR